MEKSKLKEILKEYTKSSSTLTKWINGERRPGYEILISLENNHGIPFKAWKNIKSYLQSNNTTTTATKSSAKTLKEVS